MLTKLGVPHPTRSSSFPLHLSPFCRVLNDTCPFACGQQPVAPTLYLYPHNMQLLCPETHRPSSATTLKFGHQTNTKTTTGKCNGYLDSKVLNRQHTEVWEQDRKVSPYLLLLLSLGYMTIAFAFQICIRGVKKF